MFYLPASVVKKAVLAGRNALAVTLVRAELFTIDHPGRIKLLLGKRVDTGVVKALRPCVARLGLVSVEVGLGLSRDCVVIRHSEG